MPKMQHLIGLGGGGRGKAAITLTDNTVSASDLTTYTFSTQSIGTAVADRKIIVGVAASGIGTESVSTLTVAGISAVLVAANNSGDIQSEIWIAEVPSGTTGDVVVVHTGGKGRCGIGVYRAVGSELSAYATAANGDDPMSVGLFLPTDGIAVGVAIDDSTSTYTWTNLTEAYDETLESGFSQTGASVDNGVSQTATITCDPSNAASSQRMILASWQPI